MKNVTRGQLKKRSNSNKQMNKAFDITLKQMKMMYGDNALDAGFKGDVRQYETCLLYTSPSPRD